MSTSQIPLSSITGVANTVANYPGLRCLFDQNSVVDNTANTITDSIAGSELDSSGDWTIGADGQFHSAAAAAAVTGTGSAISDITGDFVAVLVGDLYGVATFAQVGNTTTSAAVIIGGGDSFDCGIVKAPSNLGLASADSAFTTTLKGVVIVVRNSANTAKRFCTDGSTIEELTITPAVGSFTGTYSFAADTSWAALTGEAATGKAGLFCIQAFDNGAPTDESLKSGLAWMAANPTKLYPGWQDME